MGSPRGTGLEMSAVALEIIFLGTGTSHGVPMIGCDCPVCRSGDPRDRRNRCSLAVRAGGGEVILIDTPPELRVAAVAWGLIFYATTKVTFTQFDIVYPNSDDIFVFCLVAAAIGGLSGYLGVRKLLR